MVAEKENTTTTQRIEWIDLSKGIAILFLIPTHALWGVGHNVFPSWEWFDKTICTFTLPFFFFLSGFFFKKDSGWFAFSRRKAHNLLIPFVVFLIIALILHIVGTIWFLLCLFATNMLGYFIITQILSRLESYSIFKHKLLALPAFCIFSIICGYTGSYCHLENLFHFPLSQQLLPALGTAVTVLPYFIFGYYLHHHTAITSKSSSRKEIIMILVFLLTTLGICASLHFPDVTFALNKTNMPYLLMYVYGILESLSILLIAKQMKRIPIISYIGHYSIILMLTHPFLIIIFSRLEEPLFHTSLNGAYRVISCILIVFLEVPIIWLSRRFIPFAFGLRK